MRRILIVATVMALLAGAAGLGWWATHRGPRWTTRSPQAAAEFEAALAASQKLYGREARKHLEKAVALDPGFVVARALLAHGLEGHDPARAKAMAEAVRKADLSRMTPRERFLVELTLAQMDGDEARIEKVIREYGSTHPEDPFVLYVQAQDAWRRGDLSHAEPLYRKLIEVAPNWVLAYNELGYMAMDAGRFKDAEDLFVTYRFIAPDQANPHDSLGELDILTGRYTDARKELEAAIAVRPDFCAAYRHLVTLELLDGRPRAAREAIGEARQAGACPGPLLAILRCAAAIGRPALEGRWKEVRRIRSETPCRGLDPSRLGWLGIAVAEAAVATGHGAEVEEAVRALRSKAGHAGGLPGKIYHASAASLEAILEAASGDLRSALDRLLTADRQLGYGDANIGLLKLTNRLRIAAIQRRLGEEEAAERTLREVARVNPTLVRLFLEDPDRWLPGGASVRSGDGAAAHGGAPQHEQVDLGR